MASIKELTYLLNNMRLQEKYTKEIVPALQKELDRKNVHMIPKLEKVVLNVGVGKDSKDNKFIDLVADNIRRITGQEPVRTAAKKSISNFKLRKGSVVGLKVTLRNDRMYDFIERLVAITLPRVRDFSGINPKAMDDHGNLTIGFKEQIAFPEIVAEAIDRIHGLEVTLVTNASNKEDARALYNHLGIPFKKD